MQNNDNFFAAAGVKPEHIFKSNGVPIAEFYDKCRDIGDIVGQFYDITDEQSHLEFVSDMYSFMVSSPYYRQSDRNIEHDQFHLVILQDLLVRMRSYVVTPCDKHIAERAIKDAKRNMIPRR